MYAQDSQYVQRLRKMEGGGIVAVAPGYRVQGAAR